MFIETHSGLTFIKSSLIQAYPCGRRSFVRDDNNTTNQPVRIPFDPEARLNTEANNRKYSSLNGFTQTYLNKWDDEEELSLSLAGYLFTISSPGSCNDFGKAVLTALGNTSNKIYANILLEEVPLYSSTNFSLAYNSFILRNQSQSGSYNLPEDSLDLEIIKEDNTKDYYFSGLSFSAGPLTVDPLTASPILPEDNTDTRSEKALYPKETVTQQIFSLCILEKVGNTWQIHEPARLPKIEHGDSTDSIVVGDIKAGNIKLSGSIQEVADIVTKNLTVANKVTTTDLEVSNEATIKKLGVTENANIQDLDVVTNIDTKTLEVSESITAPVANINNTLNVQSGKADAPAIANMDKASINSAELVDADITTLDVTAKATIKDLEATTLNAGTTTLGETTADKLTVGQSEVTETAIKSPNIEGGTLTQAGNPVPVIELVKNEVKNEVKTEVFWQLQITKINVK